MKSVVLACISFLATVSPTQGGSAAWKIDEGESISLNYTLPPSPEAPNGSSALGIDCSAAESDIVVPVPPGIKPPTSPVRLVIKERRGSETLILIPNMCLATETCTDRPTGDVSVYQIKRNGRDLALRVAREALSISIDAPGAKVSAAADRSIFTRFAQLCREHP
jgi:hypothetical protein